MSDAPAIAGVLCPEGQSADAVVAAVADALRARGLRPVGYVQRVAPGGTREVTLVEDVATGQRQPITQDLGACATGCALDPAALAEVAGALQMALEAGGDLLIVNRFGRSESEGRGLRGVIEAAVLSGVPVLAMVRDDYAPAWAAFTGGEAVALPAERDAILAWADAAISAARSPA